MFHGSLSSGVKCYRNLWNVPLRFMCLNSSLLAGDKPEAHTSSPSYFCPGPGGGRRKRNSDDRTARVPVVAASDTQISIYRHPERGEEREKGRRK